MPEGDTIFKLAAYLQPALQGREIAQGFALAQTRVDLGGRCIGDVYARGKHLFIELDADRVLRSHLGMWGSWHAYAPDEPWKRPHERASILIDIGSRIFVCFQAKEVEWQHRLHPLDDLLRHPPAVGVDPDPVSGCQSTTSS